jgi:NAD(P)-dependent dehydrogenase (short-subunit alcohol dehydrogenase family)
MEQGGHALIVARADLLDRPLPAPAVARDWLLLGDAGGVAQALAERLRRRGDRAITVAPEAADSTDLGALIAQMPALHGVVHLRALDDSVDAADPVAAMAPAGTSLLRLAQALLQGRVPPAGLVCATRAAQAVVPGEEMSGWRQAGLWGMGRVFDQEHPELGAVRIDLPARADARSDVDADAQALLAELDACDGVPVERRERQIALRGGRRHRARLQRCSAAEAGVGIESVSAEALRCEAQATYLITGGLGGLGLATADRLVARGARHLLLLGRRAPDAAAQARLAALAAQGVEVRVAAGDVADGEALAALLASLDPRWPLRGVVHAVGVLDDRPVLHQDGASLDRVLGPKVRGAWNLHRLTQAAGMRLDFFVMYAAAAGLLGNRGQANHAAANTALDALAAHRRALGLPALAIDWGAWADIGAAAQLMRERGAELVSRGLTAMAPEQALAALEALMAAGARAPAHLGVMAIDWATYLRSSGEVEQLPYFAALAALQPPGTPIGAGTPAPGAGATTTAAPVPLRQQLAEVRGAERAEILTGWLQQAVADTLRLTELPDSHTGFSDLGMDSLMTIELRRHLSRALELPLPSTIAFEYPSVAQLRDHLLAEVLAEPEVEPESAVAIEAPAAAVTAVAPDAFDDLDLDQLSEAELGALIDDELARLDD